eukprot:GHUV01053368.1.p1 GENE.GHUV01053368.1~~GHUV01053368.1.p1  ORF type:complete len:105 (-),score=16.10 GHUV01053368.1:422-736(-)
MFLTDIVVTAESQSALPTAAASKHGRHCRHQEAGMTGISSLIQHSISSVLFISAHIRPKRAPCAAGPDSAADAAVLTDMPSSLLATAFICSPLYIVISCYDSAR